MTHFRSFQLHKQLGEEDRRSTNASLVVLHEWNLLGVLKLHLHHQQRAERAAGREIQAVKQQTETCAGVSEVLLVNRLKTKARLTVNGLATKEISKSYLLKDRFDRITHHKVIIGQLQEHLA